MAPANSHINTKVNLYLQWTSKRFGQLCGRGISHLESCSAWAVLTPRVYKYTGLFETSVGVLTTCHTQYTWDSSICIFLFNRTTLQVFVTYLIGALCVHPLWFYKHQHDNRVRFKVCVACQLWWFQWRFLFVPSVPGYLREGEERKPDPWRNPIERNHMGLHLENEVKTPSHF